MQQTIVVICLFLIVFVQVSCSPSRTTKGAIVGGVGGAISGSAAVAGVGALLGAWIGYDIQRKIPEFFLLEEDLTHEGVQIVKLGETIKIILPAEKFFYPESPRLLPRSYPLIHLIDEYINHFETVRITVTAFTDITGSELRNLALTRQQAQNLIDFMWRDRIDTRLLVARGYAGKQPIANNGSAHGRRLNRRVEIVFTFFNAKQIFAS